MIFIIIGIYLSKFVFLEVPVGPLENRFTALPASNENQPNKDLHRIISSQKKYNYHEKFMFLKRRHFKSNIVMPDKHEGIKRTLKH